MPASSTTTEFDSQEMTLRPTTSGCQASPRTVLCNLQKIAEQGLGLLARQLAAGGAQMPSQPKPYSSARPAFRRRRDLERRLRVELDQAAGEAEMAVIDLGGEARVGGAQILGRKQELFGLGARIADARHAQEHEAPKGARPARNISARPGPGRHEGQSPCSIISNNRPRLQNQAPRGLPAQCLSIVGPPPGGIKRLRGPEWARMWLFVAFQARGKESVHAAPFRRPEVELIGKGPQESRGL